MNPSWKTFESGADEEGFFDPAQELFVRAKTLIDSVVRERGQNTADNGFDSKKPIELYFDVSELNTVDFPGREDVVRILNSCKSYNLNELKLLDDNPAVVFCEDSINKLSDLNGKISFLEIGDSNTTGITGDDHDRTSGWFRMCQSIGVSVGAGTGGGSRGMGKKAPFLIKEVAILIETNGQNYCNATILVTAPLETRIQRILERDKTSKEIILKIIKNQLPEQEKIRLATYVIENENLEKTYELIDILIKKLNNI